MENKFSDYLNSDQFVGLDRFLILQRRFEGYLASRMGITALGPLGVAVVIIAGFLIFG